MITIREMRPEDDLNAVLTLSKDFLAEYEEHRRKGIGTHLLDTAVDYFRNQKIKYFTFYTSVANQDAIELYEKCGMKPLHTSFIGET